MMQKQLAQSFKRLDVASLAMWSLAVAVGVCFLAMK